MPLPPPRPQVKYKFDKKDIKLPAPGTYLKSVQFAQAIDALGNKKTLRAGRGHYLITTEHGVLAVSEDSQRAVEVTDGGQAREYDLADIVNLAGKKPEVTKG